MRQPQSSPTVGLRGLACWLLWQQALRMDVLPTFESPTNMILMSSSQFDCIQLVQLLLRVAPQNNPKSKMIHFSIWLLFGFVHCIVLLLGPFRAVQLVYLYQVLCYYLIGSYIGAMDLKGKQIKNYILGDVIATQHNMHLLAGSTPDQRQVSILMIDKAQLEQQSFVSYVNMLQQNSHKVHPHYHEPIQSTNNIYVVVEKLIAIQPHHPFQPVLASLLELYRNIGQFKVEQSELFLTAKGKVVYLPFYKNVQTSSKFYAQFHNKSVLAEIFARVAPIQNKNRALQIFIQNVDSPNAYQIIVEQLQAKSSIKPQGPQSPRSPAKDTGNMYPQVKEKYPQMNEKNVYPSLEEDEKEDEEILRLMSEAKVNTDMKQEAAMFQRQSVRQFQQQSDKEMKHIMEMAKSNMPIIKKANKSSQFKTKMDVKLSTSKLQGNQFDVYFQSYYETLRFIKKSIRVFLQYYRNGFSGIVASYLLALILTLRKAYMIKDLECHVDIFQLDISMSHVNTKKYVPIIAKEMRNQAKMVAELRTLLERCEMPYKTFAILAPFLEEDISVIDLDQLQSFSFYYLTALMKGRQKGKSHFMYFIEVMYILLHKNYEIVFFESDFSEKWDSKQFEARAAMIGAILPSWSLN